MYVEGDISENLKKIDCDSVYGIATPDGNYKKTILFPSEIKKRIPDYTRVREKLHVIMIYELVREELPRYTSMRLCHDIGKNKMRNLLLKLFSNDEEYRRLNKNRNIKIESVKGSFVDSWVKNVRKRKKGCKHDLVIQEKKVFELLKRLEKKTKKRRKINKKYRRK